ncbi:efflux RND transporter periplasmic adaptor subunit [Solimonas sp. C16B3]|uniref:Efflux RND transporter periplasmic adaptor subunit n=2 Tax=Solimonas marina TaxID=2714601 RepID=A0A970B9W7_9GAMM|nr:efflux RND transporter periplasmic adaptor subunit [Solimonas marina]
MIQGFKVQGGPKFTVSTEVVKQQDWQPSLDAVGSLRAVRGATLSNELAGIVHTVDFTSGQDVEKGQKLLELVDDSDIAAANALRASRDLAKIVYQRSEKQYAAKAISQAQLDTDKANLASAEAQLAQQEALVAKKTVRAPFSGRLGISTVNPGQFLAAGADIVPLQQLDPIYVDFNLPQQELSALQVGAKVEIGVDAFAGTQFAGKVTAIDPIVDTDTRNIKIEAVLRNPEHQLLPGMFAKVQLESGAPQQYLTLPQTAIAYNPYGETVYVVVKRSDADKVDAHKPAAMVEAERIDADNAKLNAKADDAKKKPAADDGKSPDDLVAYQVFVTVGPSRGGQVAILDGLKAGDVVVTSGQLKLQNGATVVVNNSVQPAASPDPQPVDQ